MRHLIREMVLPLRLMKQSERTIHMTRLKSPRADHLQLLSSNGVRVEGDVSGIRILAEHEKFAAIAAVFDPFVDSFRVADALDDDIGSEAASRFDHLFAATGEIGIRIGIYNHVRTELASELQAMRRSPNGDGPGRTRLNCDRKRRQAHRAGALDHYDIAPRNRGTLHPMNRCGERTACADYSFGAQGIRDAEDGGACAQQDLFGITSAQVRSFRCVVGDAVGFACKAACGLILLTAIEALATRDGTGPADAITHLQRIPAPVLFKTGPHLFNAPDGLMAQDDGQWNGKLSQPQVDIGSTNAGHLDANEDFAKGQRCGRWIFPNFERLFKGGEDCRADAAHWPGLAQ